jgi:hypothetical protein
MTKGGVALAAAAVAIALAGCESTEQESAKIAKRLGHETADATVTQIGGANAAVRVDEAQVVHSSSGTAAALELTNTSAAAQADVPIVITVKDASGATVYSNDTVGDSSPSGELALLPAHATVWWVDGSVLASGGTAASVTAQIGKPAVPTPAQSPLLSAGKLSSGSNFVGPFIQGTALNASSSAQSNVTVYVVAVAGGRVVAAGQGLVPSLAAHGSAAFQVNVTGSAKGATPQATVAPAHLG